MEITDNEIIAQLKREPAEELRRLQRMPYDWKVEHALDVIREFFEHEGESGVYVSFSGGKDSLEARIEIPLVRGRDDTMCRCCLRMLDEEIYHHNYGTVKEIEMMEADL